MMKALLSGIAVIDFIIFLLFIYILYVIYSVDNPITDKSLLTTGSVLIYLMYVNLMGMNTFCLPSWLIAV